MAKADETRVKICGITTAEDAGGCLDLGADYMGLIFADSPRRISIARAVSIRENVPCAQLVGVFADAALETVLNTVRWVGLDLIQLHGRETPCYCRDLAARSGLPLLKAVQVVGSERGSAGYIQDGHEFDAYTAVDHFLFDLDKRVTAHEAGAILPFLWKVAARQRCLGYSVFLAGALSPANVREAVRETNPHGVDVCSGVEKAPGRKDLGAVERFIREAKSASP